MKFNRTIFILLIVFALIFGFSSCVSAAEPTKILVTQTPTGGSENGVSSTPSTSADGRYVAFESYATNLGPGGSGSGIQDIFVYDSQTNSTQWITHSSSGGSANGNSYDPTISSDGRYVAFVSSATNLGPGGSGNGIKDIYVYDRINQVMTWITHSPNGGAASNDSSSPAISADGSTIAFQSTAKNLGPGGSEYYVSDIYAYNRISGTLEWVTQTKEGKTANGSSKNPTINSNGRYIAFETTATNLGPNPYISFGFGSGISDIFCYDRVSKTMNWATIRVPQIWADPLGGQYSKSVSVGLNMNEPGTIYYSTGGNYSIYSDPIIIKQNTEISFYGVTADGRRSNITSETYIISEPNPDNPIVWASPSGGTYYNEVAVNLNMDVGGKIYYSTGGSYSSYTGTLNITKTTTLLFYGISSEKGVKSNQGNETYTIIQAPIGGINPSISADGGLIAFESVKKVSDTLYINNIYLFNRNTGENMLITQTATGGAANGNSKKPSISGDGKFIAFETTANNLGADPSQPYGSNIPGVNYTDLLFRSDIFVYDVTSKTMRWITKNPNNGPANGNSYNPSLDYNGDVLAYSSSASNLGPGGSGIYTDIFMEGSGLTVPANPPVSLQITANPNGGTSNSQVNVSLSLNYSGTIYYTTDGTDPKTSGTRLIYGSPIQITSTTQLRYIGVDQYNNWSPSYSQTYTINQIIPPTNNSVSLTQLYTATLYVKNYYESHSKTLPTSVTINSTSYTMPQFLYLLATGTVNLNMGNFDPITVINVNPAPSPSGSIKTGNIQKNQYISLAQGIQSFINTNGRAPNYQKTTLGNMPFKYLVYMYSKIINYYATNKKLPNYVSMAK